MKYLREPIDDLWKLLALGVVLWVMLTEFPKLVQGATAESRVRVLHAYMVVLSGPQLPDSLNNRPRRDELAAPAPAVDIFQPYVEPAAAEVEPDHDDAEFAELLDMRQAIALATPGQVLYVAVQDDRRCPPCAAFRDGELGDCYDKKWPIIFFRIDRPSGQRLTRHFGITATPTTIAVDDGTEVGRFEGRPASASDITNLFKPQQPKQGEPVAIQARRSRQATDCRMHVWGGWTWPGNGTVGSLRRHLSEPPHNFNSGWLNSLAPSQLVAVHDSWHNQHGSGAGRRRGRRMAFEETDQPVIAL